MKKLTVASVVAVLSLLIASSPAQAIDVPTASAWLMVSPCEANCLDTRTFDSETGIEIDSHVDETDTQYQDTADVVEVDPVNNVAYFVAGGELYVYDLATTGSSILLADESILPSADGHFRGLALDLDTGNLFIMWYDTPAAHYYLDQFDPETQTIVGDGIELDDILLFSDSSDATFVDDELFVLTNADEIVVLDRFSGEQVDQIAFPANSYNPRAIGTDADGNLRVALVSEDDFNDVHFFVYDGSWSDAVDVNDELIAFAWWDIEIDDFASNGLADTGFDGFLPIVGAFALLATGALVTRRRARL